jgi:signal transduction histidine kinase
MRRLPHIISKPSSVIIVLLLSFGSIISLFEYYDFETKRLSQKNTQAHELLKAWNDLVSSTKDLLIANDLSFARQRWISSISTFDHDLKDFMQSDVVKNLTQKNADLKNKVEGTGNLWYIIKPRIESVTFSFDEYLTKADQKAQTEKRSLLHELMYQMERRGQSMEYILLFDLTFDIEYMVSSLNRYFIAELTGTIQILDSIVKRKSRQIIMVARVSASLIFAVTILFIIFTQRALNASTARLRFLSTQLIQAGEKERQRISRELHDEVGQGLTAIKFSVENAQDLIEKGNSSDSLASLNRVVHLIQNTMSEARNISVSLRPASIDQLGIIATISWFCREYQKTYTGIEIDQAINLQEERVPQPLKIIIYRVVQESLTNIAKHSNARNVSISLGTHNGRLNLSVEDDGNGFDIARIDVHPTMQNGFGLISMRERVELSGGEFEVYSDVGEGTRISARWKI